MLFVIADFGELHALKFTLLVLRAFYLQLRAWVSDTVLSVNIIYTGDTMQCTPFNRMFLFHFHFTSVFSSCTLSLPFTTFTQVVALKVMK